MTKETTTMLLTLVFMAIGILYQVAIGVIYQRMIQQADTLSGTDNKLLKQCKERFINCYKLNGGVSNIPVFVDKYINRIRVLGMSINFMKHLSGQLMLAGVFVAGFGVFSGIIEGHRFVDLLPYYIISLFGIYLYLSAMSIVDMPGRRRMLKTNLTDYLKIRWRSGLSTALWRRKSFCGSWRRRRVPRRRGAGSRRSRLRRRHQGRKSPSGRS